MDRKTDEFWQSTSRKRLIPLFNWEYYKGSNWNAGILIYYLAMLSKTNSELRIII